MKFQFLPENFSRSENAPPFETRKIRLFEVERIFLKNKKMLEELRVLRPPTAGKLNVMSDKEKELRRRREALLRLEPENHSLTELLAMMKRKKYRLSETTLRSDLKALEEAGLILRSNRKGGRPRKAKQ